MGINSKQYNLNELICICKFQTASTIDFNMSEYICKYCNNIYDDYSRYKRHLHACDRRRQMSSSSSSRQVIYQPSERRGRSRRSSSVMSSSSTVNKSDTYEMGIHMQHLTELCKKYEEELSKKTNELNVLQTEYVRLREFAEEQVDSVKRKELQKRRQYESDISLLETENTKLKSELRNISTTNVFDDHLKEKYVREISEKNVQMSQKETEYSRLQSEMDNKLDLQRKSYEKQIAQMEQLHTSEINGLRQEYEQKLSDAHKLVSSEKQIQTEGFNKQMNSVFLMYKTKLKDIQDTGESKVKAVEKKYAELKCVSEDELSKLRSENKQVRADANDARSKLERLELELKHMETTNALTLSKMSDSKDSIIHFQKQQLNTLRMEMKELQKQNVSYSQTLSDKTAECARMQQTHDIQVSALEQKVMRLSGELEKISKNSSDKLFTLQNSHASDIRALETRLQRQHKTIESYSSIQERYDNLSHENKTLQLSLQKLQHEKDSVSTLLRNAEAECAEQTKTLQKMRSKCSELESRNAEFVRKLAKSQHKSNTDQLSEEYKNQLQESVKSQLQTLQNEHSELKRNSMLLSEKQQKRCNELELSLQKYIYTDEKLQEARKELKELKSLNGTLQSHVEKYRSKLADMERNMSHQTTRIEEVSRELNQSRNDVIALQSEAKKQIEESKQKSNKLFVFETNTALMKTQIHKYETEKKELEQALVKTKQSLKHLEQELFHHKQSNSKLQSSNDKLTEKIMELRSEADAFSSKMKKHKMLSTATMKRSSDIEKTHKNLVAEISGLNIKLDESTRKLREMTVKYNDSQSEFKTYRSNFEIQEGIIAQEKATRQNLHNLQETHRELSRQLDAIKQKYERTTRAHQSERDNMQSNIKSLESMLATKQTQLKAVRDQLVLTENMLSEKTNKLNGQEELQTRQSTLTHEKKRVLEHNNDLQKKLDGLQHTYNTLSIKCELQAKALERMSSALDESQCECSELREKQRSTDFTYTKYNLCQKEVEQLQIRVNALETENRKKQSELDSLRKSAQEFETLSATNQKHYEDHIGELENTVKKMEREIAYMHGHMSNMKALESSNSDLKQELQTNRRDIRHLEQEIRKKENRVTELSEKCKVYEEMDTNCDAQLSAQKQEYERLLKDCKQNCASNEKQKQELVSSIEQMTAQIKQFALLKNQHRELDKKHRKCIAEKTLVEEQLHHAKEQLKQAVRLNSVLDESCADVNQLKEKIAYYIKLVDTLKSDMKKIQETADTWKTKYQTMHTTYSELKQRTEELQVAYDSTSTEEYEKLRGCLDELQQEYNELLKQHAVCQNQLANLKDIDTKCVQLTHQCSEYRKECDKLRADIKNTYSIRPTVEQYAKLEEQLAKNELDRLTLEKRIKQMQNQVRQNASLSKSNTQLETENKRLQQDLNSKIVDYKQLLADRTLRLRELEQQTKTLEQKSIERKELQRKINDLQKALADSKKLPEQLNHKVKRLRDDSLKTIHKYIQQQKNTERLVEKEKAVNTDLMNTIETMTNEIDQLTMDMEHMLKMKDELKQNFLDNLNTQKMTKDAELSNIQELLKSREHRIDVLENMLSKFVEKQIQ